MVEKLAEFDTVYCGDSVEWCPSEEDKELFVCGTYQLEVESNSRLGCLYLFSWVDQKVRIIQQIYCPGILDSKWARHKVNNKTLLGVVTSDGKISIYQLVEKKLEVLVEGNVSGQALSLDWSSGALPDEQPKILISDSTGSITLMQLADNALNILTKFTTHKFEAWIAAFNYFNSNVFYSGGDDSVLNIYDVTASASKPVLVNKTHNSGVTSIHCNYKKEFLLASGSFDEEVREWDTRQMKELKRSSVGGGVWRVRWSPDGGGLAAACMHAGFTVVCPSGKLHSFTDPHSSLAYGIDWSLSDHSLLAACSFYDKKLSIQRIKYTD